MKNKKNYRAAGGGSSTTRPINESESKICTCKICRYTGEAEIKKAGLQEWPVNYWICPRCGIKQLSV